MLAAAVAVAVTSYHAPLPLLHVSADTTASRQHRHAAVFATADGTAPRRLGNACRRARCYARATRDEDDGWLPRRPPPPAFLPALWQLRWRASIGCECCGDTRAVPCPNCEAMGGYTAMGSVAVACKACRGKGRVVCRACFVGDGYDIEAIRQKMGVPD